MNPIWTVLIPTCRNEGGTFSPEHHARWEHMVLSLASGLTIFKPAIGLWLSTKDRDVKTEQMLPIFISCTRAHITTIVDLARQHYEQEAIMYWLSSEDVFLCV